MRTPSLAVLSLALAGLAAVPSAAAPARAATARTRSASAGPRMVLPFIQDDYAKALAQARARKVPLFIESWAPW